MKSEATISRNLSKSYNFGTLGTKLQSKAKFSFINFQGNCDYWLLFLTVGIIAFGLVMVYSASYIYAQERFGDGLYYFRRHLVFLGAGIFFMTVARYINYKIWQKLAWPLLIISTFAIVATMIPGMSYRAGGASRWINFGGITIQPAEFAKLALVIFMAARLSKNQFDLTNIRSGFINHLWPALVLVGLCLLQPDFGSAMLMVATTYVFLFLAGVRLRYLLGTILLVLPLGYFAIIFSPYRKARLMSFLDPWSDPQNSGFQIIQSFLAFYRGGFFGVGLGNSKEKIFYLPEAHNDFILAVVGEELGFLGILVLVAAFSFLIFRAIRVAAKAGDHFGSLLAGGLAILLGFEVFWNACIVLGLFPTKGMNMPFISSGGTSILCSMLLIGILLGVSAQSSLKR